MKIKFMPDNVEFDIKPNESVLKVAHDNGIHIKSVCKGVPSCAECKIQIIEGEHNVFPPLPAEINLIGSAHFVDRSRLSCQLKCFGDVTIDLKEQIEKAGRNLASKRPRGSRAVSNSDDFDLGASAAIQGSIILDDKKVFEDIEEDEKELAAQREARAQQQRNQNQQRNNQNRNRPQQNNQRPQQGNRTQPQNNQRNQQNNNQRAQGSNRPQNQGPRNNSQRPQQSNSRNNNPAPQQNVVPPNAEPKKPTDSGNKPE